MSAKRRWQMGARVVWWCLLADGRAPGGCLLAHVVVTAVVFVGVGSGVLDCSSPCVSAARPVARVCMPACLPPACYQPAAFPCRSRSSAPAAGLESPARPQQPEETRSLASAAQQAAHTRRLVVRQQRGRAQQEGSLANWQEDGQVPGGGPGSSLGFLPSIVSGASGPTNGSPGFKPAQEAEQARWQEPAAQQRQQQQDRPRGMLWDLGVAPWEPHLPAAVEARVRSTRTAVQRVRQVRKGEGQPRLALPGCVCACGPAPRISGIPPP